jgi:hypothetical protein
MKHFVTLTLAKNRLNGHTQFKSVQNRPKQLKRPKINLPGQKDSLFMTQIAYFTGVVSRAFFFSSPQKAKIS